MAEAPVVDINEMKVLDIQGKEVRFGDVFGPTDKLGKQKVTVLVFLRHFL